MRALLPALVAVALTACGGLENEPLTYGVVRGTLVGTTLTSSAFVFGRPDLIATPDVAGGFEIRGIPEGSVEVLALINADFAERKSVQIEGGLVTDLGTTTGRPVGYFELELIAPGFQSVSKGSVSIPGTPLSLELATEPNEWVFHVPAGCYQVSATVPGLGAKTVQACASETQHHEVHIEFPVPDGSPGREGCEVSGCQGLLRCLPDRSCG